MGILILIAIALGFSNYAKKHGLLRILWGFLGVVGYYAGAFLGGMVAALLDQSLLDDTAGLILVAFLGGAVGVGGMFFLMYSVAKNQRKQSQDTEILDEEIL